MFLVPCFLSASLLTATLAWQAEPERGAPAVPAGSGVEITYLANAGFYLESVDGSVLIDACLREPVGLHSALPGPVHGKLTNARPPFDRPSLVLVSHEHLDHVQARVLEKLLVNNPGARLVTSQQVVSVLQGGAQDFEVIRGRVESVQPAPGTIQRREEEGLSVGFFRLEHSGKGHPMLVHLGHLIELGGLRILHVGDAEPNPANFAAYDLDSLGIDVALVPYWYFGSVGGAEVLREQIQARTVIACHVPPSKWAELSEFLKAQFPEVVLFKESLEKKRFLPTEPDSR
ncbi:MAG: MBL fold metallo-hydrolase [Planctomycetes bacterium]|nr:MBL fold metallo-hydrolase [Planctomycetota bacterium]